MFLPCCYRVLPCFAKTCCFTSKPAETLMTSLRKTVNHVLVVFLPCLAVFAASRPSLHIRCWVACVKLALPALVQVVLQTPVTKNQPSQDLDRSTGKQTLQTVQMQDFFVMRGGQDHARGTKHRLRNFVGWINAWCCGLLMTVCWRFYLQRHGCKSIEKTPQTRRLWRHTSYYHEIVHTI